MIGAAAETPGIILIADGSSETLTLLSTYLETAGYEVHSVRTGTAVLEVVETLSPDLVLLDISLPQLDGYQVCRQLKATATTRPIPVVFISEFDQKQERLQAFEVGGADYITKPFWPEEVRARVSNQITTYQLQRRLQRQTQRALSASGTSPLLADLQRVLRRQAHTLQEQNQRLQREIREREQMEKALRLEKYKSEQLLLNILPKAIVEQLKQLKGSLAERFDDVTILFADIVDFTPLAAQISPLELVNWLNGIFSEFDRLAGQLQLEKIKTIGDAYMVVGGLPVPRDDHAEAVMEMAIAMQEATQRFSRQDNRAMQLRIGINTGPVVAGVIGIQKFSYDLWGDAVNIASRMEAQGEPGMIQVTEATYRRLRSHYRFEPMGQVLVKGRGYMTTFRYVERGTAGLS
ncbi:family 3 Adenylate cyclase [Halomicronema hongdechloris C2206]|uniref:Family 3 Adenylate cyclase n=1 Tax=Halomicronema hongdechloris C2206 TaxID=1641165 RepID=A0A1Z3HL07_9CYAN|nr:adenylate/guanylate cyclase domain-containing protein [Halomicronema hongdechloris]ASC70990.1 family 3 Adenylate cyclase [Halomicronema hongdechloris C2206]